MLKYIMYLIFVFSLLGIVYLLLKIYRRYSDKKLLDNISDNVKNKLIRTPSHSLMNEENKKLFKKINIKSVLSFYALWLILSVVTFLLFSIRSIVITGKEDTSLIAPFLWVNILMVLIFVYFSGKDILRASKFRKIYEIRAFCADERVITTGHGSSTEVSLVYYDYKKMQYCITSVILSVGFDEIIQYHSFCWAMAVEKKKSIKVFDISPRIYEK